MRNVLILDTPSRFTRFGGEQRIAGLLYRGLKRRFKTFYLGSETGYLKADLNTFMLPHVEGGKRSAIYDNTLVRMAYYFVYIRGLKFLKGYRENLVAWTGRIKPQVIIDNSVQDYRLSLFIKRHAPGAKRIYIDHGSISTLRGGSVLHGHNIPLSIGTGLSGATVEGLKRKFLSSYDLCVALNLEQFREMKRYAAKVAYIPNGIERPIRVTSQQKQRLMERYGIAKGDFVVLNIGRMFERQKNIGSLIRAFMKLKGERLKLVLVGTGPDLAEYRQLARPDGRIVFVDPLSEENLSAMYEIAGMFVLPSIWEGLPLTLLEAANHALPIVISENIYFEDFKKKGIKLDTFDPYNIEEIRDAIAAYSRSRSKREAASRESERLGQAFSLEAMLRNYSSAINRL
ncbi:MAG: glycosyltransferase family 4 protein [Candidatus Micrarchaeota archaeon]|nr:glycosyltransferase family 4 protein [Candidatus Micrarchaeota archaeon]